MITLHCEVSFVKGVYVAWFYIADENGKCWQDDYCHAIFKVGNSREELIEKGETICNNFNQSDLCTGKV